MPGVGEHDMMVDNIMHHIAGQDMSCWQSVIFAFSNSIASYPASRVRIFAALAAYSASGAYPAGRESFLHSLTASPAGRLCIFASLASI